MSKHPVFLYVVCLVFLALMPWGCKTAQPDPDNGVSNASYRLAFTRTETNLDSVAARMEKAKADDLASPSPAHSPAWWDAEIDELRETRKLLVATLQGATFTATVAPK